MDEREEQLRFLKDLRHWQGQELHPPSKEELDLQRELDDELANKRQKYES